MPPREDVRGIKKETNLKGRNMPTKKRMVTAAAVVIVAIAFASPTFADVYSFYGIVTEDTGTGAAGAISTGVAQMQVEVTDATTYDENGVAMGRHKASFVFTNTDSGSEGVDPSITGVFWDDGTLLEIATINNGPGVSFSEGGSPPDLPAGQELDPPFVTTKGFLADSDPPAYHNGVNEDEWLEVVFDLKDGKDFASVRSALNMDPAIEGSLRIGIHVQAFDDDYSATFVHTPTPSAVVLGGLGFVMLGAVRWVKKRRAARSAA